MFFTGDLAHRELHLRNSCSLPVSVPIPFAPDRQRLVPSPNTALRGDANVADIVYSPAGNQWGATPIAGTDDATAFARYVCFVLDAQHVTRPATSVRVIDNDRLEASGFDYNRASRGRLTCEKERTEERPVGKERVRTCRSRWMPYY